MKLIIYIFIFFSFIFNLSFASSSKLDTSIIDDLELIDQSDLSTGKDFSDSVLDNSLTDKQLKHQTKVENFDASQIVNEAEDFKSLKKNLGVHDDFIKGSDLQRSSKNTNNNLNLNNSQSKIIDIEQSDNFDVTDEEKSLLALLPIMGNKIKDEEWSDLAKKQNNITYKIEDGDTLWKISEKFFGTGFYYSKIWALNSFIENPHQIEPGMTLVFSSGSNQEMPGVQLGKFKSNRIDDRNVEFAFENFGEGLRPKWLDDRKKLLNNGKYFVYGSNQSYGDIKKLGSAKINYEFQKYVPPVSETDIVSKARKNYDLNGFDINDKIVFNIKAGYSINTFITSNIVQDFGKITDLRHANLLVHKNDHLYVKFEPSVKVISGDRFSIYHSDGKIEKYFSDREGYRYTIVANIKILKDLSGKWEAIVEDVFEDVRRGDRITLFTPKIPNIQKTFNRQKIDAQVLTLYKGKSGIGGYEGGILYLNRGRLDGVEFGNVFKFMSSKDNGTLKNITKNPTYMIGQATVISVTDNFSTAIINSSSRGIIEGTFAQTMTYDEYLRNQNSSKIKKKATIFGNGKGQQGLDNLDLELNISDLNKDLLDKAEKIQFNEDELKELDRQEQNSSIIKNQEQDIDELNRIEREINKAKKDINAMTVNEDQYLEQQNLNTVEKKDKKVSKDAFSSMEEMEKEIGKRYLEEDINAKENPFGLSKFDLEEVDLLLKKNP